MSEKTTPSQTVGPFFDFALLDEDRARLVDPDHPDAIRIEGSVYDGAGDTVHDAMLEIWQANGAGRYAHPEDDRNEPPLEEGFSGFGRSGADENGRFAFTTVKPGAVPAPGGGASLQAPHINVSVFARGLLKQLVTRIYFPDEEDANAADPALNSIADPGLRSTLVARPTKDALRFDVHLQGEKQTAFFDV